MVEISKKDLLERTGISYGQLYRWKRERLIPEEWFVKRSAITGQETYFPREQILDRVEAILDLKEDHSHEEIRTILASEHSTTLGRKRIESLGILPEGIFDRLEVLQDKTDFKRAELAFMVMVDEVAKERKLSEADSDELIERTLPLLSADRSANSVVFLIDASGKLYAVLAREGSHPVFDPGMEIVRSASLADLVARLKIGRFDGDSDGDGDEEGAAGAASGGESGSKSGGGSGQGTRPKIVNVQTR